MGLSACTNNACEEATISTSKPASPLVVAKFGGTSVATRERWETLLKIVRAHRANGRRVALVCSALGKTSDFLDAALRDVVEGRIPDENLRRVLADQRRLATELGLDADDLLRDDFARLYQMVEGMRLLREVSSRSRAEFMSRGEMMSTRLGAHWLQKQGLDVAWRDARTLLRAVSDANTPDTARYLAARCDYTHDPSIQTRLMGDCEVVITQGFLASDDAGDTVLLGRGGSDTSAAYLAARAGADDLEIWTDVPGLFTADPRIVPNAVHLERVTYTQAETLAALGARVLHPRCIEPVREAGIQTWVRSTLRPDLAGTCIEHHTGSDGIKAVLTRSGLALATMRRPATWQPVGFLADVARCFHDAGLSMDMISASPGTIQATLDLSSVPEPEDALQQVTDALAQTCTVDLERDLASLSVVGSHLHRNLDRVGGAMAHLRGLEPRMVVHPADDAHMTFVMPPESVRLLAMRLHAELLEEDSDDDPTLGERWTALQEQEAQP